MPDTAIVRAVVLNDGEVLILQNVDDDPSTHAQGNWEVPGGVVETHDRDPQAAVEREVREETGLDVAVVEQLEQVTVTLDGHTSDCQYYLAAAASRDVTLSDEHQDYRWIRPGEARDVAWYYYSAYTIPVLERLAEQLQ